MDTLTKEDLTMLSAIKSEPAVSLYAPMHQAGPDTRENHIRFKNRVQEAEAMLEQRGLGPREVASLLEPASALVDDEDLWQHQYGGFAMFLSEGESHHYSLPTEFEDLTVVGSRYHLKPLMPLLTGDGRFHILVVSLNKARLFEATRHSIHELDLGDVPTSLDEATRFDEPTAGRRQHGGDAPQRSREVAAPGTGISHGTGDVEYDKKEDIRRWFSWLENGVTGAINAGSTPLVFVGVHYLFAFYQQVNHYNHLLSEQVSGNPDAWREDEILDKAWEIVTPHFAKAKEEAIERYQAQVHQGTASSDLSDIVLAAMDGRVDTLIVGLGEQQWGSYDRENRKLELHDEQQSGDEDLLDLAAVQTLLNGGTVYAVPKEEVPEKTLAAIYRY